MTVPSDVVFLVDVDNTLLDNDRVTQDLSEHLRAELGEGCRHRYFEIFETLRGELGYTDYLGTLQRLAGGVAQHDTFDAGRFVGRGRLRSLRAQRES